MARGQQKRCSGSEETMTTSTTTSNGVFDPPVTVPDFG